MKNTDPDRFEDSSGLVIEVAKLFINQLLPIPGWKRGFLRFETSDSHSKTNGSYVLESGVNLLSALNNAGLYTESEVLFDKIKASTALNGRFFKVCLLIINSDFSYEILFEYQQCDKWLITKLNGASGIPIGLE